MLDSSLKLGNLLEGIIIEEGIDQMKQSRTLKDFNANNYLRTKIELSTKVSIPDISSNSITLGIDSKVKKKE
jgi:hypothetical protein